MSEAASVYGVMTSWLTPSFLFVFINLVIGTIAITSRFANTTKKQQQHHQQLVRSPSLLDRLTSFNFGYHNHNHQLTTTHGVDQQELNPVQSSLNQNPSFYSEDQAKSFDLDLNKTEIEELNLTKEGLIEKNLDQVPSMSLLGRVRSFDLSFKRGKIERQNSVEQQLTLAPSILQRLKSLTFERSESVKEVNHESEGEVKSGEEIVEEREEEGVDAKADDFINRFRQQLRLQRLDSILRYKDMLKRN